MTSLVCLHPITPPSSGLSREAAEQDTVPCRRGTADLVRLPSTATVTLWATRGLMSPGPPPWPNRNRMAQAPRFPGQACCSATPYVPGTFQLLLAPPLSSQPSASIRAAILKAATMTSGFCHLLQTNTVWALQAALTCAPCKLKR